MKISVVIPAYNAERTIGRAIDSVLAQNRPADEVIVVDDGSIDGTAGVAGGYGDKVRLIQQANAGVSVARNTGIEASTGDWIAFLDSDDEWLPEKLERQAEHLHRHPDLKWTYTNLSWKRAGQDRFSPSHPVDALPDRIGGREYFDDYLEAYVSHFFASTITLLISREVFKAVGMFKPGMKRAQDTDLWFRIAYQFPKIGYLSQPLAIYHLDTPDSSTKINDDVGFMIHLVNRHEQLAKQSNRYQAFRPCMAQMLQIWIRQLLKQRRKDDARLLLRQFKEFLPVRFCREIRFRLMMPVLGDGVVEMVFWFKKKLRS